MERITDNRGWYHRSKPFSYDNNKDFDRWRRGKQYLIHLRLKRLYNNCHEIMDDKT